jgi:hypothetical protein
MRPAFRACSCAKTRRERDRADRVTQFMRGIFRVADRGERVGNAVTARELLDKAAKEIESGLAKDPELQAHMMRSMGIAYLNLGNKDSSQSETLRAPRCARRSVSLCELILGHQAVSTTRLYALTVPIPVAMSQPGVAPKEG